MVLKKNMKIKEEDLYKQLNSVVSEKIAKYACPDFILVNPHPQFGRETANSWVKAHLVKVDSLCHSSSSVSLRPARERLCAGCCAKLWRATWTVWETWAPWMILQRFRRSSKATPRSPWSDGHRNKFYWRMWKLLPSTPLVPLFFFIEKKKGF